MRQTEVLQGVRMLKFRDVLGRCEAGALSKLEAAEVLGIDERTFRRWCRRFEEEGEAGLMDRRLGKPSTGQGRHLGNDLEGDVEPPDGPADGGSISCNEAAEAEIGLARSPINLSDYSIGRSDPAVLKSARDRSRAAAGGGGISGKDGKGMDPRVYLVQVIDVNWIRFAPIDPARGYMVEPPPVAQCIEETAETAGEMLRLMDGRFVFTPHSGLYNRKAFYEGGFLDVYREAIGKGAELAIHLHEEIQYGGQKYGEPGHVTGVVSGLVRDLAAAGIRPVGYRGGYYAYTDDLTPFLEEHGMFTDLSALPGLAAGERYADWRGVPYSSFYLGRASHRNVAPGAARSRVLEIPMGCDGQGTEKRNHLYIEASDLDVLKGIWQAITARAEKSGQPQIIHALFHTSSTAIPALLDKFRRFVDHMASHGAEFVTASEAKRRHDAIVAAGAAA